MNNAKKEFIIVRQTMFLNKVNEASISGIFSSICMMNKVELVFFSEWCVQSNLVLSSLLLFVSALR